jgi:SAM-dependent methyltransferase
MRFASRAAAAFTRSRLAGLLLSLAARTPLRRYVLSAVVDPATGTFVGSGDMERDWDERARRNARFFVAGFDWQSEEQFRKSGERDVEGIILKGVELAPDAVVLEIGCGLGRLLRPMSKRAREAHGVDISSEMVRRASEELRDCPNVHVHHTDGSLLPLGKASFDFCYSYTVFQHISDKASVLRYFADAAELLKPGALFRFQICRGDERGPRSEQGGSWLGVVFSEDELRNALSGRGFTVTAIELDDSPAVRDRWDSVIVTCRRNG